MHEEGARSTCLHRQGESANSQRSQSCLAMIATEKVMVLTKISI